MSTVELKRFAEYVIRDGNFLHHEKLLPNNEKYEDDENEYHYQQIRYKRNCTLNTFLYTYNNSTEAKVAFFEKLKATSFDSVSDSQYEILIEEDNYTICASPVKNTSTFFDLEAGEFKSKELRIDILYGNYNICFIEHTSNYNPILYKLAKEEKMFDSEYTLKVRN